jgi:hypothetical protein
MPLNSKPNYASKVSELNSPVELTFTTRGLNAVSLIIEAINGNFNNQSYSIYVSNSDLESDFIRLRDVKLGYKNLVSNSFTVKNQMGYGSPLYHEFFKISVPALGSGVGCKILLSGR